MNLIHKSRSRSERGTAMIAGVFVVLVVSVMSMSYLQLALNKNSETETAVDKSRAFYMAEAGIAEGYAAFMAGNSGVVASPEEPAQYADGVFWVEAEALSTRRTQLTSTGLAGVGRTSLTIVVEREAETIAQLGLFGDQGVEIGSGAVVDGYDSRLGYGAGNAGDRAGSLLDDVLGIYHGGESRLRINSNEDITFGGTLDLTINGDVTPGPGGSLLLGAGVSVLGSTTPNDQVATLRTLTPPRLERKADFVHSDRNSQVEFGGVSATLDLFAVQAGTVRLTGPTRLVVDTFNLAPGANLEIDTTKGPVRIFVMNQLRLRPGATLVTTQDDPTSATFIVNGADAVVDGVRQPAVTLEATGDFHGLLYAPEATAVVAEPLEFFGSIVSKRLLVESGAALHFDEALLDVAREDDQVLADMISWRFVPLPKTPIVQSRLDPIKWMQLNGRTIRKASESHDTDWDGDVDAIDVQKNIDRVTEIVR